MENNKAFVRDLLDAGVASNKQILYFIIGSLFSYMGYNLVVTDNKNYTATTFIMIIGLLFYSCIMCNNIQFEDDNIVIEHYREKYLDKDNDEGNPVRLARSFTLSNEEEDEVENSISSLEEKQAVVASYTLGEKVEIIKYLLEDVCGVKMEDAVVNNILEYIVDLADAGEANESSEGNESSESSESSENDQGGESEISEATETSDESGLTKITEVTETTMQDLQKEIETEINEAIHEKNE